MRDIETCWLTWTWESHLRKQPARQLHLGSCLPLWWRVKAVPGTLTCGSFGRKRHPWVFWKAILTKRAGPWANGYLVRGCRDWSPGHGRVSHRKDRHCLSLWELQFARPYRGILEEPSKVYVRDRTSCKHLPGPAVKKAPFTVTDTIMFLIRLISPLSPARISWAGKGQKSLDLFS